MNFEERLDELVEERFQEDDFEDYWNDCKDKYRIKDSAREDYNRAYVGSEQYKKDLKAYDKMNRDDLRSELEQGLADASAEAGWECDNER